MDCICATPDFERTTDLDGWKKDVTCNIDARIRKYPDPDKMVMYHVFRTIKASITSCVPTFIRRLWRFIRLLKWQPWPRRLFHSDNSSAPQPHQIFLIPELLENILQFVDPQAQVQTAWNVSRSWRATVQHIIKSDKGQDSFRIAYPCPAVEHGEEVQLDPDVSWLQPTSEELQQFYQKLRSNLQEVLKKGVQRSWPMYIPPRLVRMEDCQYSPALHNTENDELLETPSQLFGCYNRYWYPFRAVPGDKWTDFSQFRFNPYICAIFSSRMTVRNGICEIKLKPGLTLDCMLLPDMSKYLCVKSSMGSTFLTQPPCRSLIIGVDYGYWEVKVGDHGLLQVYKRQLIPIDTIRSETGIQCEQFLDSLEKFAMKALIQWRHECIRFKAEVSNMSTFIDGVWGLPSHPTLYVQLGNTPGHLMFQLPVRPCVGGPRVMRQWKWMPTGLIHPDEE